MKYPAKIFSFITRAIVALGFITLTASGVFLLSYFLGSQILSNPTVIGSDNTYHLSWIHVLDRFWPRIPLWFQYQASGSSVVFGYWVIPYYAVLKLAHSSALNIEQSLRLIQFLTIPIVAFELYLFGWLRLKNHVVGLIAALLYPLSSIAWGWIAHAGFHSMHVSLVTVIPALIFYDAYLESALEGDLKGLSFETLKRRLNLLGAGVFIAASLLVHLAAGASLLLGLPLFTLVRSLFRPKGGLAKGFLRGVGAFLVAALVGAGLAAFLLLPQRRYFAFQAQDFTPYYSPKDFPYLPWRAFLGLERLANVGSLYTPLFLSKVVTMLGLLGIVLGLILRSSAGALGVIAIFYVFLMSQSPFLSARFPFLNAVLLPTNMRAASIPGALFPLLAGYGIYTLIDLPGRGIRFLLRNKTRLEKVIAPMTLAIAAIPAILIFGRAVYKYRNWQEYPPIVDDTGNEIEGYSGYGALGFTPPFCVAPGWEEVGVSETIACERITPPLFETFLSGGYDLKHFEDVAVASYAAQNRRGTTAQLQVKQDYLSKLIQSTKKIEINPAGRDPLFELKFDEKIAPLNFVEGTRISISPHLGGVTHAFNAHSSASMTNSPAGTTVLTQSWQGIQDQAFFQPGEATHQEVSELAKWFGIRYAFLHLGDDEKVFDRYPSEGWSEAAVIGEIIGAREFKNSPGIAVVTRKPAVLVIGSQEKRAYESVFRVAAKGALSYDEALLIQGKERVDAYSLEELRQFQVIISQGYSYKNRNKAWGLLSQYVEGGGNLFIDTGWQYVAKDWSTKKTGEKDNPVYIAELEEPFPVRKTTWGNVGGSWEGFSLDEAIAQGSSLSEFGSLTWEDRSWSLAYANKSDLAPWAEPVLYNDGNILIARGKLGDGKVIWSGMNLFSHAYDKKSAAEYQFMGKLFDYLLEDLIAAASHAADDGQRTALQLQPKIDRSFPDQVTLSIEPTSGDNWLYWAETYTPDWKAYLVSNDKREPLKIFRAGPGFQAINLPAASQAGKIVLEYDLKKVLTISFGITILTFLILVTSILDPLLLKRGVERRVQNVINKRLSGIKSVYKNRVSKTLAGEEEEY